MSLRWIIVPENKSEEKKYNFNEWSVKQIREFARKNNIKIPSKSKKNEIIKLIEKIASHPEFVDRTQDNMDVEVLEEELVAGEEDDPALLHKEKLELKFWQKPPFSSLLDPEVAK